jgi:class 3 adenylate cyclase
MSPEPTIYACSRCGHPPSQGDRFCSQCGNRIASDGQDSSLPVMRRERKIASVMFADVKGSTEIVSHDDPERASEWLEHILDLMRNAVHRFGGTVTRVQGDGVMALFGAPVEYEDHCIRACAAALAMLDDVNREPAGSGPALKIRVGIGSGEVMTLPVASDTGINYDAMGAVVHLAARLEQAASPNSALISLETWHGFGVCRPRYRHSRSYGGARNMACNRQFGQPGRTGSLSTGRKPLPLCAVPLRDWLENARALFL